jgi:hypothetical protein
MLHIFGLTAFNEIWNILHKKRLKFKALTRQYDCMIKEELNCYIILVLKVKSKVKLSP